MLKYFISSLIIVISVYVLIGIQTASVMASDFRIDVEPIKRIPEKKEGFTYGPGDYSRELKVERHKRYYELHVPKSYDKSSPVPVVLVFHGGGGDPGPIRYESSMDATSDHGGFIAVYAAGTNKRLFLKNRLLLWNDGRPYQDGTKSNVDDVAYVSALLDDMSKLFNIDKNRIYACGYSNGAQFTFRLAKRMTGKIAAIAAVAGQRPAEDSYDPSPSRPISVLQFAGLEDKVGPYHGGKPEKGTAEIKADGFAIKDTIASWVKFNKCPDTPVEKKVGKAVMKRYAPCKDGTEVVLWTLEDGGHTWPGGRVVPNVEMIGLGSMGNINKDINASDIMWEFFKSKVSKQE